MTNPGAVQYLARLIADQARTLVRHELAGSVAPVGASADLDPFDFKRITDMPQLVLVINCGSSSLKCRLFDTERPEHSVAGLV